MGGVRTEAAGAQIIFGALADHRSYHGAAGATIDFLLLGTRHLEAARRLFQNALAAPGHPRARVITVDRNPSYPAVIQELKWGVALGRRCSCCRVPYINNIVEQDHRAIKRRINAKLGFRSFDGAWCTIPGYEAIHRVRKGQVRWLLKGEVAEQVRFINATFSRVMGSQNKTSPQGCVTQLFATHSFVLMQRFSVSSVQIWAPRSVG